ncbi:rod-binding protein [Bdellovibrio sp. HCB117]|uniref:rod-binding protein n=1 Tax=Bdellovibrio sp. HCB117 TaxID=3394359 RepID=UPI0039B44E57
MSDFSGAAGGAGNFKAFGSKFLSRPVPKSPEQKLREVSDMYEKHFLREMTKAMRSTIQEGGFIQTSHAEKIFREQLDDHYVEKWGERGGVGLSDMIYTQLVEKFGVMMGIKTQVSKPQGPLPLDTKSFAARPFQHPGKKQSVSYRIDNTQGPQGADKAPEAVKAPWDGVLLGKKTLADDQTMIEIEHDNGLKSQMVFKGGVSKVSTGEKLQAGDTLGFLSPEAKSLYWTVEKGAEPGPETVSE